LALRAALSALAARSTHSLPVDEAVLHCSKGHCSSHSACRTGWTLAAVPAVCQRYGVAAGGFVAPHKPICSPYRVDASSSSCRLPTRLPAASAATEPASAPSRELLTTRPDCRLDSCHLQQTAGLELTRFNCPSKDRGSLPKSWPVRPAASCSPQGVTAGWTDATCSEDQGHANQCQLTCQ
jgi:hypothetical protein